MSSSLTDRRNGLLASQAIKAPVKAASAAAIAALTGLLVVDGYQTVSGDRVLVKNQADQTTNGIYNVASGVWSRAKDADGNLDWVQGTLVFVLNGAVSAGLFYRQTTAGTIVVGTSNLAFSVCNPGTPLTLPLALANGGTAAASAVSGLSNLGVVQVTAEAGTANAQTGTIDALVTALRADQIFEFVPSISNTGAATLTLTPAGGGALAAKNIFANGVALVGNELVAGVPTLLHYDGVQLNIIGHTRSGALLAAAGVLGMTNGYLDWSVAGNVLTVAIKTLAGADPSAADPVFITFRNVTAATGSLTTRKITAATSIGINNTALLGTTNNVAFRLWCVAFDDAGTVRLGIINCVSTVAGAGAGRDVTAIYPLKGWGIASSTLEDNASDAAQVFYTDGAACAAKAYATLGSGSWEAGLAAAGTWSAAPTRAQLHGVGMPLPGDVIQVQRNDTGAAASGATATPKDDTIPQITEGDQYLSQAITPSSAANVLAVEGTVAVSSSGADSPITSLHQDATANALASLISRADGAGVYSHTPMRKKILAAGTVATTFRLRTGTSSGSTLTFNGAATARTLGGAFASFIEVTELMA